MFKSVIIWKPYLFDNEIKTFNFFTEPQSPLYFLQWLLIVMGFQKFRRYLLEKKNCSFRMRFLLC